MTILALLVTTPLLGMLAITLHNIFTFPRLTAPPLVHGPAVSILIPARNEEAVIGTTVLTLCQQRYPTFELLVLDDHSTDNTAAIIQGIAANDTRVRLITGAPLPAGWSGKNWACDQLAHAARHDLLLFTDADVRWQPNALAATVMLQQATDADLLTVWPTQITVSWGERLIVPLMTFAVWAYLPLWLVHYTPFASAAAANGQCLLFRHAAYRRAGGHAAIRQRVLDDVLLAQQIKRTGGRLRMADGAGLVQCRMYTDWRTTHLGYAKNILAGHINSPLLLVSSILFHLTLFVGPWLWLMVGMVQPSSYWPVWPLLLVTLGLLIRFLIAHATGQRLWDSVTMPVGVLLMTAIAGQALWWRYRGGPQWKGRVLSHG